MPTLYLITIDKGSVFKITYSGMRWAQSNKALNLSMNYHENLKTHETVLFLLPLYVLIAVIKPYMWY